MSVFWCLTKRKGEVEDLTRKTRSSTFGLAVPRLMQDLCLFHIVQVPSIQSASVKISHAPHVVSSMKVATLGYDEMATLPEVLQRRLPHWYNLVVILPRRTARRSGRDQLPRTLLCQACGGGRLCCMDMQSTRGDNATARRQNTHVV